MIFNNNKTALTSLYGPMITCAKTLKCINPSLKSLLIQRLMNSSSCHICFHYDANNTMWGLHWTNLETHYGMS